MKKPDFKKGWESFVHWKGWKVTASACKKAWYTAVRWKGWGHLFGIPLPFLMLLCVLCGVGLIWVFARGMEAQLPAYCLYPLSAYSLTALCVKLPGSIRSGKQWLSIHPKVETFLHNKDLKFRIGLYSEQFINFAYGIFKIVSGVVLGSAWIGCEGIYNLMQALIQLFQIIRRKRQGSLIQQWRSYRFCGVLIFLMHLSLTGIVFQMINWNRADEQGQIQIIATAFFAFYKIINSFISVAKDRKHAHPVDSSIRMLSLSQAFFSIFSLQASMFHTFGTGESWEQLMNILTGCTVCLLIVSTGIYMVRRGNRELKKIQEGSHG